MDKAPKKEKLSQNRLDAQACENALRYKLLFNSMAESFALSELVFDADGKPKDYRYLEVNRAFENFLGLRRNEIVGKLRSEILIPLTKLSFKTYSRVALTGKTARFKNYNAALDKYYIVNVYSPAKNQFATIFNDITGQEHANKKIEHLASFPQMNPNPIVEVGANGEISFLNKAAKRFLSDSKNNRGGKSLLPSDIIEIIGSLGKTDSEKNHIYRELAIDGKIFAEDIHISKKLNAIRIYAKDITERKKTEEALRENEEKYRELVENANSIIVKMDNAGVVTFFNDYSQKFFGYSSEEIVGKNVRIIIPAAEIVEGKDMGKMVDGILKNPDDFSENVNQNIKKNGEIVWISWRNKAIKDASGKIVGNLAIGQDITERKRAEEALRESEEKYRNLVKFAPAAIYEMDLRGNKLLSANEAMCDILGYSREELLKIKPADLLDENSKTKFKERIGKKINGDKIDESVEYRIRRKDGKWIDASVNVSEFTYADEKPASVVVIAHDITQRKKLENLLQTKSKEQEAILDSAPAMIFYKDKDNHFLRVNKAFGNSMGISKEQLEGRSLFDIFPKEQADAFWKDDLQVIKNGKAKRGIVEPMNTPQGTRTVETDKIPYLDGQGNVVGVIGFAVDITERKKAEEAFRVSELKYRRLFESAKDGILILDFETGMIMDVNPFLIDWFGYSHAELLKKHIWDIGIFRDIVSSKKAFSELQKKEFIRYENMPLETKNGKKMFVEFISNVYLVERKKVIQCNIRDITERKLAEENLNRLNRTLEALNGINHSILRAKNEKEFLTEVCRIIVQDCGHKMVWIGFANDDEEKTVEPVSWAGFENGYMETLNITWADRDRGRGPTGTAIRTGEPQQCKNMLADPNFIPWRKEALKRGYSSSIAIPLKAGNKILGAITIYSKYPDPFTKDEVRLLIQLANDTAYGIYTLNLRQDHATAVEKLRETSEYLDNLINYANAPIIVWDPNFRITKFNTASERLTGLKSGQALGRSLKILFPAKSKNDSMEMIKSTLAGKRWEVVEIQIKRVNGDVRTVVWNSANILGDSDNVVATIAQGQDITERKIAEEKKTIAETALKNRAQELENAVRELENLHLAVENASDIIFIADPQGIILSINKAVEKLLNYQPGEMVGKKMRALGLATDQKKFDRMWEMIKVDKKNFVAEIENRDKSGRKMIFELYVSPVLDNNGEIIFLVGVVRDRTEAKIADRAKTEFISLAAHQLRTPLSTISMASEMLTNGNVGQIDADAKEQLQEICSTAHKMAEMIELFLNISRIELGRLDINPEMTNIVDFARGMAREIASQASAKNISLANNFAADIPDVNLDRKIMHIALENLLTNAIKYTQKGGKIVFSVSADSDNIIASVSDNGRGIPKGELPLLFNKMFRATNVDEVKGLGLGLNMTKSAIEQCGGLVSVESEENKGSTFSISIPLSGMKKKKIRIEQ